MICAYLFTILALISLPSALKSGQLIVSIAWIAQTFLQLCCSRSSSSAKTCKRRRRTSGQNKPTRTQRGSPSGPGDPEAPAGPGSDPRGARRQARRGTSTRDVSHMKRPVDCRVVLRRDAVAFRRRRRASGGGAGWRRDSGSERCCRVSRIARRGRIVRHACRRAVEQERIRAARRRSGWPRLIAGKTGHRPGRQESISACPRPPV